MGTHASNRPNNCKHSSSRNVFLYLDYTLGVNGMNLLSRKTLTGFNNTVYFWERGQGNMQILTAVAAEKIISTIPAAIWSPSHALAGLISVSFFRGHRIISCAARRSSSSGGRGATSPGGICSSLLLLHLRRWRWRRWRRCVSAPQEASKQASGQPQ